MTQVAEDVAKALRSGVRVRVTGPEGSGRSMLASEVTARLHDAQRVDLPAFSEPDAPAAILLAAAALLGDGASAWLDAAGRPTPRLASALARLDRPVVIRAQGASAWATPDESDERRRRLGDAIATLSALRSAVWIIDADPGLVALGPESHHITLPDHRAPLATTGWAGLTVTAEALASAVAGVAASPVVWRLAVGAIHLGADLGEVAARARQPTAAALPGLATSIARAIQGKPALLRQLHALMLARAGLRRASWSATLDGPWRDLLTHAIGYGDPVRVNPLVRAALAQALKAPRPEALERAHATVAEVTAAEDGITDPSELRGAALAAWVEKLHHLGHGGAATQTAWLRQRKPLPELYWDRARHLSIVRRDYAGAAAVYRACLDAFPDDPYAHHYYAWNLEKAGQDAEAQRVHFAKAVALDPRNPWWNARRISQLIRAGAWTAALAAWRAALDHVAPDGLVSERDASELHWWVAQAWLEAGVWYEAAAILASVPDSGRGRRGRNWPRLRRSVHQARAQERSALEAWFAVNSHDATLHARVIPAWRVIDHLLPGVPAPAFKEGEDGPKIAWSHPGIYLSIEFSRPTAPLDRPASDTRAAAPSPAPLDWYAHDRVRDETAFGQAHDVRDPRLVAWLRRIWHD